MKLLKKLRGKNVRSRTGSPRRLAEIDALPGEVRARSATNWPSSSTAW
jgi:hypothetical protein